MGLFRRTSRNKPKNTNEIDVAQAEAGIDSSSGQRVRVEMSLSGPEQPDLVKLSGTMTFAKDSMALLVQRHGVDDPGYLEIEGVLAREPDNAVDPDAVVVRVEGERVAYLPGFVAKTVDLPVGAAKVVTVQIFTEMMAKGLRVEAWAWLGEGAPQWHYSEINRPPLSSAAKARAQYEGTRSMVEEALAGGGARAESFSDGMVDGVHFLELVEPIKELKRQGRLEEALVLCYRAIEGAETSAAREGREPVPWYTEQAAIVHRKLGQHDREVAVLRRWVEACPADRLAESRVKARLDKIQP